jgi:hypothetical protein
MTQVAEQAVTDINGRAGDAAQGLAQGHPGAGALQAKARGRQHGSGHAKAAAKYIQRQGQHWVNNHTGTSTAWGDPFGEDNERF